MFGTATSAAGQPAATFAPALIPVALIALLLAAASQRVGAAQTPSREAFFGDLHVHTTYSMDAFRFGTRTTPDDAYAFARGEAITHPAGFPVQLDEPLDFYAVTDHAEYLGALASFNETSHPLHEVDLRVSEYPALVGIKAQGTKNLPVNQDGDD